MIQYGKVCNSHLSAAPALVNLPIPPQQYCVALAHCHVALRFAAGQPQLPVVVGAEVSGEVPAWWSVREHVEQRPSRQCGQQQCC